MIALGGCFALSCISLLGDGFGQLQFFRPLAKLKVAVGAFTSERAARVVLALEVVFILGVFGIQLMQ